MLEWPVLSLLHLGERDFVLQHSTNYPLRTLRGLSVELGGLHPVELPEHLRAKYMATFHGRKATLVLEKGESKSQTLEAKRDQTRKVDFAVAAP